MPPSPLAVAGRISPEWRAAFLRHLGRFVVIGVLSVAADFVCYRLLMSAGLSPSVAKGLSYLSGMTVGFFGNKFWTFESKRWNVGEPLRFCGVYLTSLVINVTINAAVLGLLGADAILAAYVIATAVSTATNFLGLKLVTFRPPAVETQRMTPAIPPATKAA